MSLSLNGLLDRYKQKFLQMAYDTEFRDQLLRVQTFHKDFVLTAAQMDTLNATPVSILAAPGAGLVNVCMGLFLKVNSTGFTAFELGSGVLEFRQVDGSGAKLVTDVTNAFVESATDLMDWCPPIVAAPLANVAWVAHTSTDVTAGTGNIQGRAFYKTIKVSEIV